MPEPPASPGCIHTFLWFIGLRKRKPATRGQAPAARGVPKTHGMDDPPLSPFLVHSRSEWTRNSQCQGGPGPNFAPNTECRLRGGRRTDCQSVLLPLSCFRTDKASLSSLMLIKSQNGNKEK